MNTFMKHKDISKAAAIIAASLCFVSCNKQEDISVPQTDGSAPIVLTSYDMQSKGLDDLNYESIKTARFGLFAYWNMKGERFDGIDNPFNLYLDNSDVQYVESEGSINYWKCSPSAYWPFNSWLNFFAYAPYQSKVRKDTGDKTDPTVQFPSEDYVKGMPRLRYTVPENVTWQPDFCVAAPVFDRSASDGNIHIEFFHTLTRVRFYVNLSGEKPDNYEYFISDLTIKGVVGSNILTYSDNPEKPYIWDRINPENPKTASYNLSPSGEYLQLTTLPLKFENLLDPSVTGLDRYSYVNEMANGRLYLLPQEITEEATVEVSLAIYKNIAGSLSLVTILPPYEFHLPVNVPWKDAKTVSYLMTLDISGTKESDITPVISDWVDAGNEHFEKDYE